MLVGCVLLLITIGVVGAILYRFVPVWLGFEWRPSKSEVLSLVPFTLEEPWSVLLSNEESWPDPVIEIAIQSQTRPTLNAETQTANWHVYTPSEFGSLSIAKRLTPTLAVKSARTTTRFVVINGYHYWFSLEEVETNNGWVVWFERVYDKTANAQVD